MTGQDGGPTLHHPNGGSEAAGTRTAGQAGILVGGDRYMMATVAIHLLGDISRDEPSLAIVHRETDTDWIGEWAIGIGYVNVRFPKATTRDLTADEVRQYHGKVIETAGMVRPIRIDGASEVVAQ